MTDQIAGTRATFIDENGNKLELEGEAALAMAMQKRPYKGIPKRKPFAWLKPGYRSKNASGGLMCRFTQSTEYKKHNNSLQGDHAMRLLALWSKGMLEIAIHNA